MALGLRWEGWRGGGLIIPTFFGGIFTFQKPIDIAIEDLSIFCPTLSIKFKSIISLKGWFSKDECVRYKKTGD